MLDFLLKKTGLSRGSETNDQPEKGTSKSTEGSTEGAVPLLRVNGKSWKEPKKPLRVKSLGVSKNAWGKKRKQQLELEAAKNKERELKQEKDEEKKQRIQTMKERKAAKEEKERYANMATKMHAKKVARIKKREKRNKLLKER